MPREFQTRREALAWAAGFLEGEGTFRCGEHFYKKRNRTYGRFLIQAAQIHPEVLETLQQILGGKLYGPYKKRTSKYKEADYYAWYVNSNSVETYEELKPFLGIVKLSQAHKALEKHAYYRQRPQLKKGPKPRTKNPIV